MEYAHNTQNSSQAPQQFTPDRHVKSLLIVVILIIVLLAVVAFVYWRLAGISMPETEIPPQNGATQTITPSDDDTTATIDRELNEVSDLGDLDAEFSDIDRDRQGL